jgi:hypothetical protein
MEPATLGVATPSVATEYNVACRMRKGKLAARGPPVIVRLMRGYKGMGDCFPWTIVG